jgi:spore coat protein U-like protein
MVHIPVCIYLMRATLASQVRDMMRLLSPRFIAVALASALIYFGATTAHAQTCSVSAASGNYGAVNVLAGSAVSTSSSFMVTCSGCTLGCTVNACIQFNQGSPNGNSSIRYMGNGANTVQHELYSNPGLTQTWGSWGYGTSAYGTSGVSTNLTLPVLGGSTSQMLTVYGAFKANQQTAVPGTYTWTTSSPVIAYGPYLLISPNCSSNPGNIANAGSSTWTATVSPNCNVSAGNLNFGTASLLTSAITANASIVVQCTNTTPYSVGLDNGAHASSGQRRMQSSSNFINYHLYTDSGYSLPWTTTSSPTSCTAGSASCVLGTGTGSNQNVTVYGEVPVQPSPAPGGYNDTVVVTVTY